MQTIPLFGQNTTNCSLQYNNNKKKQKLKIVKVDCATVEAIFSVLQLIPNIPKYIRKKTPQSQTIIAIIEVTKQLQRSQKIKLEKKKKDLYQDFRLGGGRRPDDLDDIAGPEWEAVERRKVKCRPRR